MNFAFVGRVVQSLKGFYNGINPATLTGAIDVVIVKQEDGTYSSSPFHVRFGKLGVLTVLRSQERVVDIEINGEPTDLQMKLGEAGEAFFVQEIDESEEEDLDSNLATSPIPSNMALLEEGVKGLHDGRGLEIQGLEALEEQSQMESKAQMSDDSPNDRPKSDDKPRRKVLKKKKQKSFSKSNLRSPSMSESKSEEVIFEMDDSDSSDDREVARHMCSVRSSSSPQIKDMDFNLQGTTSHRMMSSVGNGSFLTPYSEPETSPIASPMATRPATPKSDTEVDRQHMEEVQNSALMDSSATWQWGEFPKQPETKETNEAKLRQLKEEDSKSQGGFMSMWAGKKAGGKNTDVTDGIYLDDLTSMDDPEMARIYLGRPRDCDRETEEDAESGRGLSLPQSPNSVEGSIGGPVSFTPSEVRHLGDVSLSLCGGLNDPEGISLEKFMQKVVTFEDLAEQPNLIANPDLVVKIHDKYLNWTAAGPMVLSQIVFKRTLPEDAVKSLEKEHLPKKKKKSSWFSWGRSAETESEELAAPGSDASGNALSAVSGSPSPPAEGVIVTETPTPTASTSEDITSKMMDSSPAESPLPSPPVSSPSTHSQSLEIKTRRQRPEENTSTETDTDNSERDSSKLSPPDMMQFAGQHEKSKKKKYVKTLRLSSDQIAKMNLKEGHNEISFSVTTQFQGTARCVSHVYLWNYDDKIVISDIDGTITKSDVLGQILPIMGRDWSQSGVAELFTRIHENGYKLIYLSARAIGQSRSTKDLLKNIKQGNLVLPDGPVFLNPTSLFRAFHREVILKNPEEFKISCLKDIGELFPSSPFYAGFGNKFNDVIAYRALDIPSFRIFTINPQGQLKHDLSLTFLSSYSGMSDIVDHFFPSLDYVDRGTSTHYNPVNYWRQPLPALSPEELALLEDSSSPSK